MHFNLLDDLNVSSTTDAVVIEEVVVIVLVVIVSDVIFVSIVEEISVDFVEWLVNVFGMSFDVAGVKLPCVLKTVVLAVVMLKVLVDFVDKVDDVIVWRKEVVFEYISFDV